MIASLFATMGTRTAAVPFDAGTANFKEQLKAKLRTELLAVLDREREYLETGQPVPPELTEEHGRLIRELNSAFHRTHPGQVRLTVVADEGRGEQGPPEPVA